jgi:hypothetical protein
MCGWLAGDRDHLAQRGDRPHGVVVEVADGVPEQVPGRRADQLAVLADAGARDAADAEQVGLQLVDLDLAPGPGQLLEGGPALAVGGHPLPFVGADPAHLDPLAVLHRARRADPPLVPGHRCTVRHPPTLHPGVGSRSR